MPIETMRSTRRDQRRILSRLALRGRIRQLPEGLLASGSLGGAKGEPVRSLVPGYGRLASPSRSEARVYGRIGDLEVRLARSHADVRRSQRLRYTVFYEEMSATP